MSHVATPTASSDRPLAINLLLGVSGWVAGLFMLFFVGLLFRPDRDGGAAVCGVMLLAAAWALMAVDRDERQVFVAQLALALSIAGQCLVVYAMTRDSPGIAAVAGAALVLQVVLALVMPNRLHRTLSTLFATMAWALALRLALLGDDAGWYHGAPPHAVSLPVALLGWLAAWGPVAAVLWWVVRNETAWAGRRWTHTAKPIATGLIVGLAFATLASEPLDGSASFAGGLALWPLLSALGALGALAAAFALRRGGLMALCVVAVLLHVGHFYASVGGSLLVKSVSMLATGAVFAAAGRGLRSKESA